MKCDRLDMYFSVASEGKISILLAGKTIQMDSQHPSLFLKRYLSLIWVYSISSVEVNWIFTSFHSIWSSAPWNTGGKFELKPLSKLNIIFQHHVSTWCFSIIPFWSFKQQINVLILKLGRVPFHNFPLFKSNF